MSDREELATVISRTPHIRALHLELPSSIVSHLADGIIDAVLASGYRKPRVVTTIAELDALPAGAMILDSDPDCCVKNDRERWYSLAGSEESYSSAHIVDSLPATVLYVPEPTA